ncbi:MAG: Maltose acetyltransferase [Piccolia ochrophora]|nr:MAG: Maltose acetyltransferase [Piccolia ochrophora]
MVESPSSRFTAVNGREPSSMSSVNGDHPERSRVDSVDGPVITRDEDKYKPSTQPEDAPETTRNGDAVPNSMEGPSQPQRRSSWDQHDGSGRASPHKRKRSRSFDGPPASCTSYETHGIAKSPRQSYDYDTAENQRRRQSRSPQQPPPNVPPSLPSMNEVVRDTAQHGPHASHWYDHQSHGPRPPYGSQPPSSAGHMGHSDSQLAEALQRENHHIDANRGQSSGASLDDDDMHGHSSRGGDYGNDRTPNSGVQVDHRRRKRVFSNRTKTGCMTCRRRKKKCDEQKPECNNCIRGGFVCEGYSTRIEWQKTPRDKPPVPLQAKDGEGPPGQYPQPATQGGTPQRATTQTRGRDRSPPGYRNSHPSQPGTAASARPPFGDEDRDRGGPTSPHSNAPPLTGWPKGSWSGGNNASYPPDHPTKGDYQHVPPMHELSRSIEGDGSVNHRSIVHPSHSNSPQTPQNAQAQAQLALQHQASIRSRHRSERDKMLAGELYFPNAPELVYERDRCKTAIWRFNNSMNPNLGISREERSRLFRDVVQPRDTPPTPSGSPAPVGKVGENVVVEAPFNCDYGYNITIGPDVLIGTNCTIMDTCSVSIGARTVIGPNVNILTATMPIDPRKRKGSQGPSLGRSIRIEEDCWIGAGVIILPGRKIGKSSTVGAGSVVTRDVPRFTVVAGNPARVHRGIYANDPNM